MTDSSLILTDVERLGATLDALDLDEQDRATLETLFVLAGRQFAQDGDEVSGFGMLGGGMTPPSTSIGQSSGGSQSAVAQQTEAAGFAARLGQGLGVGSPGPASGSGGQGVASFFNQGMVGLFT